MFSKTFEYSMRAIVTLADGNGEVFKAQQISELTQVPVPYLSKVLNGLVRSGLVRSQRGLHGGFVIAADPDKVSVLDIADAVEPFQRIRECPLGANSQGVLCSLHRFLDDIMALSEEALRTTTVADLLQDPESMAPLCHLRVSIDSGDDSADSEGSGTDQCAKGTPTAPSEDTAPGGSQQGESRNEGICPPAACPQGHPL
jgi:Rrf2 family nitric oxide-sensitive transcriptional repressor